MITIYDDSNPEILNLTGNQIRAFWRKVNIANDGNDCWEWQGWRDKAGYGRYKVNGVVRQAHRVAYQLGYGVLPKGLYVIHWCNNRSCVNPMHLYLGTQADNVRDAVLSGRAANAKLSIDKARAIRDRYAAGGIRQKDLAAHYGVSVGVIWSVINRRAWNHV